MGIYLLIVTVVIGILVFFCTLGHIVNIPHHKFMTTLRGDVAQRRWKAEENTVIKLILFELVLIGVTIYFW